MARTVGWVVVVLCLILGFGFYMKWFSASGTSTDGKSSDITLSLNKDKVQHDANAVKEGAKDEYNSLFGEKTVAGTINQIDASKKDLTITNAKNHDVLVKVDANTKITIDEKAGLFADLKAEDKVSVKYTANKDGNVATSVTVAKKS